MNQILKPARPESMRFGSDPVRERDLDPRALQSGTMEYDDGEPATIAPNTGQPAARAMATMRDDGAPLRTTLGQVKRTMAVEYDDGNPATIVTGG